MSLRNKVNILLYSIEIKSELNHEWDSIGLTFEWENEDTMAIAPIKGWCMALTRAASWHPQCVLWSNFQYRILHAKSRYP